MLIPELFSNFSGISIIVLIDIYKMMSIIKTFEAYNPANLLTKEQIEFLNKFVRGSWNLVNGFVDVDGDFQFNGEGMKDFKGIKFGKISGSFHCSNNLLTSLQGCPREVGNNFHCSNNRLTSLLGAPQKVGGDFYCFSNKLTSLTGAPQEIGGSFGCGRNELTSLTGAPQKVRGGFGCAHNHLTSLLGGPQEVGNIFNCSNNKLISLEGFPQKANGDFNCLHNLVSVRILQLLCNKLKEIPIYPIALASIWSKIPEKDQALMKKDLDSDYLDYSSMGDFGLI